MYMCGYATQGASEIYRTHAKRCSFLRRGVLEVRAVPTAYSWEGIRVPEENICVDEATRRGARPKRTNSIHNGAVSRSWSWSDAKCEQRRVGMVGTHKEIACV